MKQRFKVSQKAQMPAQMFGYLFAIFVIGLLVIFGVKAIMSLMGTVEEVNLLAFKTDMESTAKRISPNFGKWEKVSFELPFEIEKVCFVQHVSYKDMSITKDQEGLCDGSDLNNEDYHYLMCDAWKDVQSTNVFTHPFEALQGGGIDLGPIEVFDQTNNPQHYLCVPIVAGKLNLKMTGKGDRILIQPR